MTAEFEAAPQRTFTFTSAESRAYGGSFGEQFVRDLARESATGDVARGQKIFQLISCVACHSVGSPKNDIPSIGPDLNTIGNTLSTERIIEEVLWPGRAVKEGYSLVRVITKDGTVHQGYEQRSRAQDVFLQLLGSAETIRIPQNQIRAKVQTGSAMPAGLTAVLKREQLRDLICFLTKQGR